MKKNLLYIIVLATAFCACTKDVELTPDAPPKKDIGEAKVFSATVEGAPETKATFDYENKCAAWEVGDVISIDGHEYQATSAGTSSIFEGEGATENTHHAFFPASLYISSTTAALPAIQAYKTGKFDMPMYAKSEDTHLEFKNLCAVLAIKVTSDDIATLKSIKVASDKKMNGSFNINTIDGEHRIILGDDGTNAVVLESPSALTLDEAGTIFYIAIPAQEYKYLNIFLSSDGVTYTQAMATKKASGLGTVARSQMFSIDYAKNATKLWEGKLFVADCNIGAKSATEYGGYFAWGGNQDKVDDHHTVNEKLSGEHDTATRLWGGNWRMPTNQELSGLVKKCSAAWAVNYEETGVNGYLCSGKDAYSSCCTFLPAGGSYANGGYNGQNTSGRYWSAEQFGSDYGSMLSFDKNSSKRPDNTNYTGRGAIQSVRAVLDEADSPVHTYTRGTAKATIDGSEVDVNWIQLWKDGPKFAEYNIGATSATDCGGHYTWGGSLEITATTEKEDFTYNTGFDTLHGSTDSANILWGPNWRMPEIGEFDALLSNCTCIWTTGYQGTDTNGLLCTGKGLYSGNTIFLPAAGTHYRDFEGFNPGNDGHYWSSMYSGENEAKVLFIHSNTKYITTTRFNRWNGNSIRAVLAE